MDPKTKWERIVTNFTRFLNSRVWRVIPQVIKPRIWLQKALILPKRPLRLDSRRPRINSMKLRLTLRQRPKHSSTPNSTKALRPAKVIFWFGLNYRSVNLELVFFVPSILPKNQLKNSTLLLLLHIYIKSQFYYTMPWSNSF